MKSLKDQIAKYNVAVKNMLDSKDVVEISRIQYLKQFITTCEEKVKLLDEVYKRAVNSNILLLKLSLKTIKSENYNLETMKQKLKRYLVIMEKATKSAEPLKNFSEKICYLENFIYSIYFSIEELSNIEKAKIEVDVLLLEVYVEFLKNKFTHLIIKEDKEKLVTEKDTDLTEFLENLEFYSRNEIKNKTEELNGSIKKICRYLLENQKLFSELKINESTYISKEYTNLSYTLQIKHTSEGFNLYVSLKRKLEDWKRNGSYKTVKKNLMLIKGVWQDGTDAVVYGKQGSEDENDKINLTLAESKRVESLNPLYVHKIEPAAAYIHNGQYKQSFVSKLADGCLMDIIFDQKQLHDISIGELFIIYYSMTSAVVYIHSQEVNIIHRDIKSDNFLLFRDEDGTIWVKISDFGLSRTGNELESDAKFVDTGKSCDMWRLAYTFQELLQNYLKKDNLKKPVHPVLEDLTSLTEMIMESPPDTRMEASQAIVILNAILDKMQKAEPSEASLVRRKLENYYQGQPLFVPIQKIVSSDFIQGFFSQRRLRQDTDQSSTVTTSLESGYSYY